MPDIFLSYSREDQAIARRFAEGLQREGFDVWWDQALNAGESFDQVTERALKEARAVVVLWTPRSVQSRWVRSEATLAHRYGTLVPATVEPSDRPIMFELTHTADLIGWKGDANDPRWQSFIGGLRRLASGGAAPAAATGATPVPPTSSPRTRVPALRWIALAAAGLLAAGLAWWLLQDEGGSSTAAASVPPANSNATVIGASMSRLTDFEGMEDQAAISPDGTLVAFVSDRDGHADIWITRVGSNEFRNLSRGRTLPLLSPETRRLEFSPDGSQVHFTTRIRPQAREGNAWSVPVLGGAVRPLLDGAVEIAWSPDGKSLAWHPAEPGDPLSVRDPINGGDRLLYAGESGVHNHYPTWSPDGAYIYFVSGTDVMQGMEIWRVASTGGTPERLTSPPAPVRWTTVLDARTLAFLAEDSPGDGMTIHLLDVESRKVSALRTGLERFSSLAASRSGRQLVATITTHRSSLWRIPINTGAVAKQPERIRVSTGGGTSPRLLGTDLLYLSNSGAGNGIWRSFTDSPSEVWSPDRGPVTGGLTAEPGGRRIAFPIRHEGATHLQVGKADGTEMRVLAPELSVRGTPAWSPDGQWIAVAVDTAAGTRLFKIPVDGGEPVQLTQHHAIDPTWSPQGGFIVYLADQIGGNADLAAVTATGEPHNIPRISLPARASRTRFLPGSDTAAQLIVLSGDIQNWEFSLIDLASGKQRQLSDFGTEYRLNDFDVSPDGREIVFDRVREESDVVLIDLQGTTASR